MELDRRSFIKMMGVTAGGLLLPCSIAHAAAPSSASTAKSMGMLSDLTRCVGCGWCQQACKTSNSLPGQCPCPGDSQASLSADNWTVVGYKEVEKNGAAQRVFIKRQCMHCLNPACASACPVGALQRQENGAVVYDPSRCIGCRYCMVACPFGIPKFDWEAALPTINKCLFCSSRQAQGLPPACAAACPTGALMFGNREALIAEAESRIQAAPDKYVPHIYGQHEIGGTSWLYLSPVPFEDLGFPALKAEPVTALSESVATYGTAGMAIGVTVLLAGVYYRFSKHQPEIEGDEPAGDEHKGEGK
jgi:formate dehydrogenase iron-sulfur subunit